MIEVPIPHVTLCASPEIAVHPETQRHASGMDAVCRLSNVGTRYARGQGLEVSAVRVFYEEQARLGFDPGQILIHGCPRHRTKSGVQAQSLKTLLPFFLPRSTDLITFAQRLRVAEALYSGRPWTDAELSRQISYVQDPGDPSVWRAEPLGHQVVRVLMDLSTWLSPDALLRDRQRGSRLNASDEFGSVGWIRELSNRLDWTACDSLGRNAARYLSDLCETTPENPVVFMCPDVPGFLDWMRSFLPEAGLSDAMFSVPAHDHRTALDVYPHWGVTGSDQLSAVRPVSLPDFKPAVDVPVCPVSDLPHAWLPGSSSRFYSGLGAVTGSSLALGRLASSLSSSLALGEIERAQGAGVAGVDLLGLQVIPAAGFRAQSLLGWLVAGTGVDGSGSPLPEHDRVDCVRFLLDHAGGLDQVLQSGMTSIHVCMPDLPGQDGQPQGRAVSSERNALGEREVPIWVALRSMSLHVSDALSQLDMPTSERERHLDAQSWCHGLLRATDPLAQDPARPPFPALFMESLSDFDPSSLFPLLDAASLDEEWFRPDGDGLTGRDLLVSEIGFRNAHGSGTRKLCKILRHVDAYKIAHGVREYDFRSLSVHDASALPESANVPGLVSPLRTNPSKK